METKPQGGGGRGWLWTVLGIVALVILAIILWVVLTGEESAGPEAGVTVSDLTQAPDQFVGQDVIVSGSIGEVLSPQAFAIGMQGGEGAEGVDEGAQGESSGEVLVVASNEFPAILPQGSDEIFEEDVASGDFVQVAGFVVEFDVTAIEQEIGTDLPTDVERYNGQPVIIASALESAGAGEEAGQAAE